DKGLITRIFERRQLHARAATDSQAAKMLAELADTRRRRSELLLAPAVKDPTTRQKREEDIRDFEKKIAELDQAVRPLLPAVARAEKLALADPAELQKVLPADAAVVDFLRYVFFEQDEKKPGKAGEKHTVRYLAFVVTKEKVAWITLGGGKEIELAIAAWRE